MSTFSSLEIGKRGLLAQKFGLDVTSNNTNNVNTEGYSRRQAILTETDPNYVNGTFVGTGVVAEQLRTFRQEFFDAEIRNNTARNSYYSNDEETISKIESILAEPSDNGINELTTEFFNAFETVANNPDSVAQRENLLSVAQTLVERLNTVAQQFNDARQDIATNATQNVIDANTLIQEIASLNANIASSYTLNDSNAAQTFVDQRELKLEQLSKLVDLSVTQSNSGMVNVFINGINIVTGQTPSTIKLQESINSITGERTLQLAKTDSNNNTIGILNPQSGELASQLKHYNVTLDANDSTGGYSATKTLDEYVNGLVKQVNSLTNTGFGLDDTEEVSPGRNFFEPSVENATALNISISSDIANARDIPLSDALNESGNNNIARAISNLSSNSSFLNNSTPSEFFTAFLGKIGNMGSEASTGVTTTAIVNEQLSNQRESAIGVDIDEEAINLIKFQRAYEASSRIINTTNEMLITLINLGT